MSLYQVSELYLTNVASSVEIALVNAEDDAPELELLLKETYAILQGPDNASEEASDEGTVSAQEAEAVEVDSESADEEAPVL